jgi:hypothetical protein
MARELLGQTISAFTTSVQTGGAQRFTALPGQIGIMFRYLAGSTLEVGGASLTSGAGYILSANTNAYPVFFPCTGDVYMIATGATSTVTGFRLVGPQNPGSLG